MDKPNSLYCIIFQYILQRRPCFLHLPIVVFSGKISWESMRQLQLLHKYFLETPKINEYSCSKSDLTYCTSQMRYTIFYSSMGSWCPLPRREKATTANAIATPIAAP